MSRLNVEHFMNRYFDLVQQNREIHNRTLAYHSLQDNYMNTMINLMQTQANQNTGTSRRRWSIRLSPNVQTAFFDLGTLFSDVVVRPTTQQISRATREVLFSEIDEPQNTRCPISQQDFSQNDTVSQIRHCGHNFYPNEINTWWARNVRCPVCRYDIRQNSEETNITTVERDNEEVGGGGEEIDNEEGNDREEDREENDVEAGLDNSANQQETMALPRIRTIPRTTFSRNSRESRQARSSGISDQEFTSYINLATQLLNNFSQGDISGEVDILYTVQ